MEKDEWWHSRQVHGRFTNILPTASMPASTMGWACVKSACKGDACRPPSDVTIPVLPLTEGSLVASPNMSLWKLSHSSVLMKVGLRSPNATSLYILTDPVFGYRASPLRWAGPRRYSNMPLVVDDLPCIDIVLISHDHYDHLCEETIRNLVPKTTLFVTPLKLSIWLKEMGVSEERIVEHDWWQECLVTKSASGNVSLKPPEGEVKQLMNPHSAANGATTRIANSVPPRQPTSILTHEGGDPSHQPSPTTESAETTDSVVVKFHCCSAQHNSRRTMTSGYLTLWCSWMISVEIPPVTQNSAGPPKWFQIFFSGDSGYYPGFQKIGERLGPVHIALMENGQYNALMWPYNHMLPTETVQAFMDLCCQSAEYKLSERSLRTLGDQVHQITLDNRGLNPKVDIHQPPIPLAERTGFELEEKTTDKATASGGCNSSAVTTSAEIRNPDDTNEPNGRKETGDEVASEFGTPQEHTEGRGGSAPLTAYPWLIPIHNSTFDLGFHQWYEPLVELEADCILRNVPVCTPIFGQYVDLMHMQPLTRWWKKLLPDKHELHSEWSVAPDDPASTFQALLEIKKDWKAAHPGQWVTKHIYPKLEPDV